MKSNSCFLFLILAFWSCTNQMESPHQNESPKTEDSFRKVIDSLTLVSKTQQEIIDSMVIANMSLKENSNPSSIIDSLKYIIDRNEISFAALIQLSGGEFQYINTNQDSDDNAYGFYYRIELYQSEIYISLYLSTIEYYGETQSRVASTYEIDLYSELGLGGENTSRLRFVKWISPNEFQITDGTSFYKLEILGPKYVKVKK